MPSQSDSFNELQRLKLMQELQKDLTDWAKSRLAPLSIALAVLGFFGLKTVVDQNVMSLVNSKVDVPIQRQIQRTEAAIEKATDKVNQLSITNELVTKSGSDAQKAANDAFAKSKEIQQRLAELQPQIDQANASVTEIEQRLTTVKSEAEIVRLRMTGWSYSVFDKFNQQSLTGRQVAERIAAFEKKQGEIAAAYQELVRNDPRLAERAASLQGRFKEIDRQYRDSIAKIDKRNSANVILMVGKGEANEKIARLAEKYLQSYGYFASVYYPYGTSRQDRWNDFEADFAGLKVDASDTGPVIYMSDNLAERTFYEADIQSVFESNKIAPVKVITRRFSPADQYLRRSDDERFDPSNIIVCYFPM